MFFIFLVFAAAIILEVLGCYISVIGLAANASIIIVLLIMSLDFSKVIIASVLYKQWHNIHWTLKSWLIPSLIFLVIVTSSGTYAFLLREFSKTTVGQEQKVVVLDLLKAEQLKLERRKQEMDNQVTQLPAANVLQRRRLTELFSEEITRINSRLVELDKEIPQATVSNMQNSTESGTLTNIAKAFDTTAEKAAKVIAFLIILVVDPLAIVLLTVANLLIVQRKKDLKEAAQQKILDAANATVIPPVVPVQAPVEVAVPPVATLDVANIKYATPAPIVAPIPVIVPAPTIVETPEPDDLPDSFFAVPEATVEPEDVIEVPVVQQDDPIITEIEEDVGIENVAEILAELADEELENTTSGEKYSLLEQTVNETEASPVKPAPRIIFDNRPKAVREATAKVENHDSNYNWEEDMDDILVDNNLEAANTGDVK